MNIYDFPPIAFALDLTYTVVTGFADLLTPLAGDAAALAVVLITLVVRAVLIPVGISQVRAEYTRRRLAPQLKRIQTRYAKNREVLARKTMELYATEKASPLAGVMPMLAQAPVISLLYGVFLLPVVNGHANLLLSQSLFGVPLGNSLVSMLSATMAWPDVAVFAAVIVWILSVALVSRMTNMRFIADQPAVPGMKVMSWMPLITGVVAAFVPLAAALYLAVSTAWTVGERVVLRRVLRPASAA